MTLAIVGSVLLALWILWAICAAIEMADTFEYPVLAYVPCLAYALVAPVILVGMVLVALLYLMATGRLERDV